MELPVIVLKAIQHRNAECIALYFAAGKQLNAIAKRLPHIKWSHQNGCWYMPLSPGGYKLIKESYRQFAIVDDAALRQYLLKRKHLQSTPVGPEKEKAAPLPQLAGRNLGEANSEALQRFIEMLKLKSYSNSTISTYRNEFLQLLQLLRNKPVDELSAGDIKRYLVYSMNTLGISEHTAHSRINALKFYFEQVLHREKFFWEIPRPKKRTQLPKIFSQDEVAAIIKSISNKKHKTMLMLAYSAGLRVSEVVHLKTYHIDSNRMSIFIEGAKGKKDRMVSLSPVLLVMLRDYAKQYRPDKKGWLFEGQEKGSPYSARSLQEVLQQAKVKAGIVRPGSMHSLRHSFATHLVEKGTDVTMIQKLLGHNDLKTTMIYLHTSNKDLLKIISPLDSLNLG